MKIDLKELGKRIKLIRKRQDLTQEMLAEKAGVSQHYIYEIEAGRKAMSIHSFASLTCALDVSADYLLFGDEPQLLDVDTPSSHNQLMEIAAELNPSQRDHIGDSGSDGSLYKELDLYKNKNCVGIL
ncbi:MAG: helix-turn-helix domain-containing protein [Anaerostipes hadrus]